MIRILHGDMLAVLPTLDAGSIDAVVTDPPYHLTSIVKRFGGANAAPCKVGATGAYARASRGFMSQTWDGGDIAFRPETWAEVLRVMKPGAHLVAFGGTRTSHRMACAIEDAGFEIRDTLCWLYGSGFPKSHDVSKGIDKAAGAVRKVVGPGNRHAGIGNSSDSIAPAFEPIILARKPPDGTIAGNVLKHGVGGLNIDACRVGDFVNTTPPGTDRYNAANHEQGYRPNAYQGAGRPLRVARPDPALDDTRTVYGSGIAGSKAAGETTLGRWPANVIHDGSDEVMAAFPDAPGQMRRVGPEFGDKKSRGIYGDYGTLNEHEPRGDSGSAARFFYSAKADAHDRAGSKHPTVKPTDLMRWLVRLVTPPGGTVLDPFCGTGSTLVAADQQQFNAVGIEREAQYVDDARRKFERDAGLFAEISA